jgi:Polysaccharide lyase
MRKTIAILVLVTTLFACNKKKLFKGPNSYFDDFESYDSIEDLIDGNNENWSFFQKTFDGNKIEVDTLIVHSGKRSIKSTASPSNREKGASKSSINKQFMAFWENEIVSIDAWYYIAGNEKANWMFLIDLEEKTAIGAGPGMRIVLVDEMLLVEHKYPNPDIRQPAGREILFPRNQWVHVRLETRLSKKKKGYVKVWQDGTLILEQYNWKTLPTDILYFQQGTKGMYSQIEFGITANTKDNPMIVYVDDITVKTIN